VIQLTLVIVGGAAGVAAFRLWTVIPKRELSSHAELLERDGHYARMRQAQSA
jgi:hypothetical protein